MKSRVTRISFTMTTTSIYVGADKDFLMQIFHFPLIKFSTRVHQADDYPM